MNWLDCDRGDKWVHNSDTNTHTNDDNDSNGRGRTGGAGNSGLGKRPIPQVFLSKVKQQSHFSLLRTHTHKQTNTQTHTSESFFTHIFEALTASPMETFIGKAAEYAGE